MFNRSDFHASSSKIQNWIKQYLSTIEENPVKSQVTPGEVYKKIEDRIPLKSQSLDDILRDLDEIIMPGITHWQHPNFHAYFPANGSIESLFAEMITAAIGAQCMIWDTSPAAAELEQRMMEWFIDAMKLPTNWEGVIQDTASTATLTALITARERVTNFSSAENGVPPGVRVYCSTETHSSIEKAVVIAGIGRKNLVKIPVDNQAAMYPELLEKAILEDIKNGLTPCCIVTAIGTTGTIGIDDNQRIGEIAQKYHCWLHVDAAYAGSAQLLPEYQHLGNGLEHADSYVFNPHKWLFTNFDCTAYFVKDANHLIRCMEVLPEYLKTSTRGQVNDYRDWGIPLGRRFRALKLWFVLRHYGLEGIQQKLRKHIRFAEHFASYIREHENLELMAGPKLNFVAFRLKPLNGEDFNATNQRNQAFLTHLNKGGKVFLSHTKMKEAYIIRVVLGQTYLEEKHVKKLCEVISIEVGDFC